MSITTCAPGPVEPMRLRGYPKIESELMLDTPDLPNEPLYRPCIDYVDQGIDGELCIFSGGEDAL